MLALVSPLTLHAGVSAQEVTYVRKATAAPALTPIGQASQAVAAPAAKGPKVKVTFFFASWCAFCKKTHEKLNVIKSRFDGAAVEFVGVSTEEDPAAAQRYAEADQGNIPMYFLKEGGRPAKPESLGVYPVISVQDKAGRVVALYTGYQEERFGQMEKAIRWALRKE